MKIGIAIFGASCVAVGALLWCSNSVSATTPEAGTVGVLTMSTLPALGEETKYSYVGTNKCKKCHLAEYKSWQKTKMGQAFDTLKPGTAADVKKKHNLDPEKDYSTDEKCLACHTTGYGHEGGYVIPDPEDKKAVRKAKKLANAGCESCHGPGSEYIKIFEDIFKTKRKYKVEELHAAGLQKMNADACTSCHNEQGPTVDPDYVFDFEKMINEDTHERKPLKQRED